MPTKIRLITEAYAEFRALLDTVPKVRQRDILEKLIEELHSGFSLPPPHEGTVNSATTAPAGGQLDNRSFPSNDDGWREVPETSSSNENTENAISDVYEELRPLAAYTLHHHDRALCLHMLTCFTEQWIADIDGDDAQSAAEFLVSPTASTPPLLSPQILANDNQAASAAQFAESSLDVNQVFSKLLDGDTLPSQSELESLFLSATEVFRAEPNVLVLAPPLVIVGDVHGQLRDLRERVLKLGGGLGDVTYLFLGDFVDRGDASLHVVALLAAAKILFRDRVYLIRGNHESRNINGVYGFLSECHMKLPPTIDTGDGGTSSADAIGGPAPSPAFSRLLGFAPHPTWKIVNTMFDQFPIAAIVDDRIFCVHGGLSPKAHDLASIVACRRTGDIASGSIMADLTWSDPCEGSGFAPNHRGCGHLFGADVTESFLEDNGLSVICRAHQCVRSGFNWTHGEKLLTLFSAPNYCGQGNDGAILKVAHDGGFEFIQYRSALSWDDELDDEDSPAADGLAFGSPSTSETPEHLGTRPPPAKVIPAAFQGEA